MIFRTACESNVVAPVKPTETKVSVLLDTIFALFYINASDFQVDYVPSLGPFTDGLKPLMYTAKIEMTYVPCECLNMRSVLWRPEPWVPSYK
jgi:hypothetical protein